jgi:hypothetical protein
MIRRIFRKKHANGQLTTNYVAVPSDWVAELDAAGYEHVYVERRPGTRQLLISPIGKEHVEEYRRQRRRQAERERHARRNRAA